MADAAANASLIRRAFDRARLERLADWLAVAVVVSLPWSTSATGILIVVWLVALIPTLDVATLRAEFRSAAGGLPVLLWLFAGFGMLWADVTFAERIGGLGGFHKLLIIPLLLAQFRRSERGFLVLYGFLISCLVLLAVSWIFYGLWHAYPGWVVVPNKLRGIPVKDYIAQSSEFLICAFALLAAAIDRARIGQVATAAGLALLAALFLANIFYVATGRTAIVVIALLLVILAVREFGWKGLLGAGLVGAILLGAVWASSPLLRDRMIQTVDEMQSYRTENAIDSTGPRLEFWKKSLSFIAQAPVIGHGTGSIAEQFRRAAGTTGAAAIRADNPHNQVFGVAIQLGVVGAALLIAMWVAHLALFRGGGLIHWLGLMIVLQNIVSSLFNSHLFDFFHGWLYVFGVGVVGGMALRTRLNARETVAT
ncbi:MAG: O-antigen ligase [Hyphomicrobiales bacterium]|nr:O-antigen ligase [Hyphomicrobiales bacterium]